VALPFVAQRPLASPCASLPSDLSCIQSIGRTAGLGAMCRLEICWPELAGRSLLKGGLGSRCKIRKEINARQMPDPVSQRGRRSTHSIRTLFGVPHTPREGDQQDLGEVGDFPAEDREVLALDHEEAGRCIRDNRG